MRIKRGQGSVKSPTFKYRVSLTPERQFARAGGTPTRNWLPLTPDLFFGELHYEIAHFFTSAQLGTVVGIMLLISIQIEEV